MEAIDNRDTSAIAVRTSQSLVVEYKCDLNGLKTGDFTFQNSSIRDNQTIIYYVGMNVI